MKECVDKKCQKCLYKLLYNKTSSDKKKPLPIKSRKQIPTPHRKIKNHHKLSRQNHPTHEKQNIYFYNGFLGQNKYIPPHDNYNDNENYNDDDYELPTEFPNASLCCKLQNSSDKEIKISMFCPNWSDKETKGENLTEEIIDVEEEVEIYMYGSIQIMINDRIIIEVVINTIDYYEDEDDDNNKIDLRPEYEYYIEIIDDPDSELIFWYNDLYRVHDRSIPSVGVIEFTVTNPGQGDLCHQ